MTGATGPAVVLVLGYAMFFIIWTYRFQKKRTLILKSLLKCLNVGLRPFALIFSMNIVCLMDSSFFKFFLYVAKVVHNIYPLVCGVFKAAVLSQGLYSVGLCSDCLGLGVVGQLTTAPAPEPCNCEPFTMEDQHLRPHPCIACLTNRNVLIN